MRVFSTLIAVAIVFALGALAGSLGELYMASTIVWDDGSGQTDVWAPESTDPDEGGPDSVNPLLTEDGLCAINLQWPEDRGDGSPESSGVLASLGSVGRHTRQSHERTRNRVVILNWEQGSGVDVELVRRALAVTAWGAGKTRFRHPMLDAPGPVSTAPWVRLVPEIFELRRNEAGISARMRIRVEYLDKAA